jgi:hypothetical protein
MVGPEDGVFILIVAVIGGFRWMSVARLVRAQFLSLRERSSSKPRVRWGEPDAPGRAPHPAQRHGPDHRRGNDRCRQRDHRRVDAIVPRARLSAGHSDLGTRPLRRQGLPRHRAVLGALSGHADLPHRAVDQLLGDGLRDALDPRRILSR